MKEKPMQVDPFSAPIPGESLTKQKGSAPYESPPQYSDLDKALEGVWDKMTTKRNQAKLVETLKSGAPAEAVAKTALFEAFSKGVVTPDMALAMAPTVHQMIVAIGERAVKNGNLKADELIISSPDQDMDDFFGDVEDDTELVQEPGMEATEEEFTPEEVAPEEGEEELDILGGL